MVLTWILMCARVCVCCFCAPARASKFCKFTLCRTVLPHLGFVFARLDLFFFMGRRLDFSGFGAVSLGSGMQYRGGFASLSSQDKNAGGKTALRSKLQSRDKSVLPYLLLLSCCTRGLGRSFKPQIGQSNAMFPRSFWFETKKQRLRYNPALHPVSPGRRTETHSRKTKSLLRNIANTNIYAISFKQNK